MKPSAFKNLFIFCLLLTTNLEAETRFITDEFKVTLRTGTSTSNSILTMLKSGQAVTFIEQDDATKYSLVKTKNGKQGYVLSRFLKTQPAGRELYQKLQIKSKAQSKTIASLKKSLNNLKQNRHLIESESKSLNAELTYTSNELADLRASTQNTVAIIKKNKKQRQLIDQLNSEKDQLLSENNGYKDSTAMDWFIRGSAVSLLAFLIGIIVTRIKWQKRDSWGEF